MQLFYILVLFSMGLLSQEYETQNYKSIGTLDGAEVRFYPEAIKVKAVAAEGNNQNFSKLFNYISKGNTSKTKIAMTTPVYMETTSAGNQMEFVLPAKYLSLKAPQPIGSDVTVYKSSAGYFIALKFGGYNNAYRTVKYRDQLEKIMDKHGIQKRSSLKVLSYDSPYTLFNRRNEVLYEVAEESLPNTLKKPFNN